jgi:type II secretory pathway pseudopilin PulG
VSLLEAVVALLIVGLAGTGWLGAFAASTRAAADRAAVARAVAAAESAIESVADGDAPPAVLGADTISVTRAAHPSGLTQVTVTVRTPEGRAVTLHRLVRE